MGCCQSTKVVDPIVNPVRPQSKLGKRPNSSTTSPKKLSLFTMKKNMKSLSLTPKNMFIAEHDTDVLDMQTKTLLRLIMSDMMANLYSKSLNELKITNTIVSYLTLNELLRLSYSCKRMYIVMGDLRVLQRFQIASQRQSGSQLPRALPLHADAKTDDLRPSDEGGEGRTEKVV